MRLLANLVLSLVALLLLLPAAAQAQVINACVNKKGSMRIVSDLAECNARENPLSWNQQGPQGEMGDPGEPGMDGEPGSDAEVLRVFDVNGRELGLSAGTDAGTSILWVFVPEIGAVNARRDTGALRNVTVAFEDAQCMGPAFVNGRFAGVAAVADSEVRYFVGNTGEIERFIEGPLFQQNADLECGLGEVGGIFGIPATEITAEDLGLPWPGPLYVAPAPE